MREQAMFGVRRGKTHRTTILSKDGVRAGDLLNRALHLCVVDLFVGARGVAG